MDNTQTTPPDDTAPSAREQIVAFCAVTALTDDIEFADSLLRLVLPHSKAAARWYYWTQRYELGGPAAAVAHDRDMAREQQYGQHVRAVR